MVNNDFHTVTTKNVFTGYALAFFLIQAKKILKEPPANTNAFTNTIDTIPIKRGYNHNNEYTHTKTNANKWPVNKYLPNHRTYPCANHAHLFTPLNIQIKQITMKPPTKFTLNKNVLCPSA